MKFRSVFLAVLATICLLHWAVAGDAAPAQEASSSPAGVPVHMVVTVEPRHGANVPVITKQDAMVYQGRDRRPVTDWIPLQGDRGGLELFILLDDAADSTLGSQLEDIRQFINALPAATKIGIAYMQNGTVQIVQNLTTDHTQASKALRLPLGMVGVNASPYFSLEDLIKRWPETNERREVLLVSDGIDRFYGSGPNDPYVDSVIEHAQKEGIIVFAVYNPGVGHWGHTFWRNYWGQIYLSMITDQTGGEGYYIGFTGPSVAFAPYLDDLAGRLTRQYLLGFLAKPEKKAGMQSVKLMTEVPNAQLVSADRVYVPAAPEQR